MKYVVLEKPGVGHRIELGLHFKSHAELAAPHLADGFTIRGAGFVKFDEAGNARTFGFSQSVNKAPHSMDAVMIAAFNRGTDPKEAESAA